MGENTKYLSNDFATATNGELKTAGARQSPALHMVISKSCHVESTGATHWKAHSSESMTIAPNIKFKNTIFIVRYNVVI